MKAIWYNGITVPMSGQDRGCCDRALLNIILVIAMLACFGMAMGDSSFFGLFVMFYLINLCDGCCNKTIKYVSNIEMLSNTENVINGLRLTRPNI
jgi:hypothetical protein